MRSACGNGAGAGSRKIVPLSNGILRMVISFAKHISIRFRYKNTDIDPMKKTRKTGGLKKLRKKRGSQKHQLLHTWVCRKNLLLL